jgi:hypothetical protein
LIDRLSKFSFKTAQLNIALVFQIRNEFETIEIMKLQGAGTCSKLFFTWHIKKYATLSGAFSCDFIRLCLFCPLLIIMYVVFMEDYRLFKPHLMLTLHKLLCFVHLTIYKNFTV